MNLRINDMAPDFTAVTTEGTVRFHDWIGQDWCVLFSHPKDFTPVCTTELAHLAGLASEFKKRGCKLIGLSVDSVVDHRRWQREILETRGQAVNYPLIADTDMGVSKLYGMLPANEAGDVATRSAVDNATVRNVFMIGPDKRIKLMLVYPMSTGRNFDEILRTLDSLQLTAAHKVVTPAHWVDGASVIIAPSVSDDEASDLFPDGWHAVTPYLRFVAQPNG